MPAKNQQAVAVVVQELRRYGWPKKESERHANRIIHSLEDAHLLPTTEED